jgi:branched-chain amino acid transport system substrate-binding protein
MRTQRHDGPDLSDPTVRPSATVTAQGLVLELNDGRGRRMLEANPTLVGYARTLLARDLGGATFVWIGEDEVWYAVRIQRLPRSVEPEPEALVEVVRIDPPQGLTPRELDVLTLIGGGLSNPEIAAHLKVSVRTVMTHVERVLVKLGQASRSGAAAMAVELGFLRLPLPGGPHQLGGLTVASLDAPWRQAGAHRRVRSRPAARPRPYLIGSAVPLSGPSSGDGLELRNGSRLAVAEINRRGGIAGRPLEQLVMDTDITTSSGLQHALRRLIEAEVDAITLGYAFALQPADLVEVGAYGCPVLSAMTSEELSRWVRGDHENLAQVFQVAPTEIHYGSGCIRFLDGLSTRGAWPPRNRRITFVQTAIVGGHIVDPATLEAAERGGWEIHSLIDVAPVGADMERIVAQVRAAEPAAVVLALFVASELAAFQRAFRARPTDALVYGIYSPSVPEYRQLAGPAAEGVLWSTLTGRYGDLLGLQFAQRYRETFDVAPGHSLAGVSYDQVGLLALAWAGVGNPRAFARVGDELRRITYRGVNGGYLLGHEGQCAISYPDQTPDPSLGQAHLVFQIQDGRQRILHPAPYAEARFRLPPWFASETSRVSQVSETPLAPSV